jgi:hypothetical protein
MQEFLMLTDMLTNDQEGYTIGLDYDEVNIRLNICWQGRSINLNKVLKLDFESDEEALTRDLPILMMKYISSGQITQTSLNGYQTLSVMIDDY